MYTVLRGPTRIPRRENHESRKSPWPSTGEPFTRLARVTNDVRRYERFTGREGTGDPRRVRLKRRAVGFVVACPTRIRPRFRVIALLVDATTKPRTWYNENENPLGFRLYETQVKKIVKVQSMLRAFITKRKIAPQLMKQQSGNENTLIQSLN